MLTEDGKAMLAKSVREYLRRHPGRKADAKRKAVRHFMDYRMAFGGERRPTPLFRRWRGTSTV